MFNQVKANAEYGKFSNCRLKGNPVETQNLASQCKMKNLAFLNKDKHQTNKPL